MESSFRSAIANVTNYGDTDIFPFPFENRVFADRQDETVALLQSIHDDFLPTINRTPPVNIRTCAPLGFTSFRWATQIDPIWNLYFLSLAHKIAPQIEASRIPIEQNTVFSYRYNFDSATGGFWDTSLGWRPCLREAIKLARQENVNYVVSCDIADFYPRLYHHRLENCLKRLDSCDGLPRKLMKLLSVFSGNTSYGLPVGGTGSRLLAEALLNNVDQWFRLQ